ncbi:Protein yls7 [Ranunculus cassubicifolius]
MGLGGSSFSALPRTVSSITISVGGLALFLIFGSCLLISSPLASTVIQLYFFRNATSIPIHHSLINKSVDSAADDPKLTPVSDFTHINNTSTVTTPQEQDTANNSQTSLPSSQVHPNATMPDSDSCDLYHGKWFYDSSGPLYTNNTCPVLTQMQNCQGNGRPDKDYENWRWKPSHCDLPRFDPKKFLALMRGKTLAFIGDSVARNQMESMLCILWQVEVPKNRGNKRMQRWFFRSTNTMIVRIWSSWLVHQSSDAIDFAPTGVVKLHLDLPDDGFMDVLPSFDVVVLSSGHWFAKQSVYILNNEIVGGQLWWPDKNRKMKVNNIDAFGISVETIMTAIGNHPNFTGLTIVRSFSPDHYEGGAWNTGGSCTGKSSPALELVENGFTNIMHEKQVTGFNEAVKKVVTTNASKLKLMDITEAFSYRHDGHPGPYRSPDPNKITKRGPHGEPPPQDCLHWCMPGPVDTWNEMVLEIIRREFEGVDTGSSSSLL